MADLVFSRFEIELDSGENAIFHGGEVITGNLRIQLRRPITIQAVRLQLKGRAAWVNDAAKKAEVEKVYFDQDFTLLERPPGRPEPGHFPWISDFLYSLPFECPLPKGCPTAYEGPHAFIRYFIRATLAEEINGGITEYVIKKPLNLIANPEEKLVAGPEKATKDSAAFGSCCCRGKVSAELRLPKTTYVPGEAVYANLDVDNRHPRHVVDSVAVRLVDRVRRVDSGSSGTSPYRTLIHRNLDQNDVVRSKQTLHKENLFLLTVPSVPPSTPGDGLVDGEELPELSPNGKGLFESPSTATLKFRKQPFLRLEYAIQVSLGNQLLLEVPIRIGAVPAEGEGIELRPFVAGSQPVSESDEAGKLAFGGPFAYTPRYPVVGENHIAAVAPQAELTVKVETPNGKSAKKPSVPEINGGEAIVASTVTETQIVTQPDEDGELVRTTIVTTTTTVTEEDPITHQPQVIVEVEEKETKEVIQREESPSSVVEHPEEEEFKFDETPPPSEKQGQSAVPALNEEDEEEEVVEEPAATKVNGPEKHVEIHEVHEVNGEVPVSDEEPAGQNGELYHVTDEDEEGVTETTHIDGNTKVVVREKVIQDGDTLTKVTETITTVEDEEGIRVTRETTTTSVSDRPEIIE